MSLSTIALVATLLFTGNGSALAGWHQQVDDLHGAMTPQMAVERGEIADRVRALADLLVVNGPYTSPERSVSGREAASDRTYGPRVERWRPLIEAFFHPGDVDWALRVMRCESGGNPDAANSRSSARGLFQHLGRLWPARAEAAGWPDADIFDPVANVAVAAWLYYTDGPSHWVCR